MVSEETLFQEAVNAAKQGELERARDLLTRFLRHNPDSTEAWLWLSTVVDSAKERIYCLKEAQRIDPRNPAVRRGLAIHGVIPPDEDLKVPFELQRRSWQVSLEQPVKPPAPPSIRRIGLYLGGAVILATLVLLAIFGPQKLRERAARRVPTTDYRPVASATLSPTPLMTATPSRTPSEPTPPWGILQSTYTPTPLYVRTPHNISEAFIIGLRAFEAADWDKALTYLRQAVENDPAAPDIYYLIGEANRMLGNIWSALEAYNQSLTINVSFAPAYLGRARAGLAVAALDIPAARKDLETAILLDPGLGEAYLELGELLLTQGQPEEAVKVLTAGAAQLPESPILAYLLAGAYQDSGDSLRALEQIELALQRDLTFLPSYRLYGEVLQANGRLADSIEPLQVYLRYSSSRDAALYFSLARAYFTNGDSSNGLAALNQVLSLEPKNLEALLMRGTYSLDNANPNAALSDFDAALRINPNSFEAGIGRSRALIDLGEFGDAYIQLNRLEKLLSNDRQRAVFYYWRAVSLETLNLEAALNDYQRLFELPEGSASPELLQAAQQRLTALYTPTPPPLPAATATMTPTSLRTTAVP